MSLEQELHAIRHSLALSEMDHVVRLRLSGPDAYDAVDAICPADLYVRDGQMLHTLFLRPDGTPFADVYLCPDDEDFIVLAEGPSPNELTDYIDVHLPAGVRPNVEDLTESHQLLSVNGPFAWELMAEVVGPEVVGLPYLTFFYADDGWACFRAGKTGEYGYDLLVPRKDAAALRGELEEVGKDLHLGRAGLEALDLCALENSFFNIRREGRSGLTPLELQLQWRVSLRKDHVGADALRERRRVGTDARVTFVVSEAALQTDDPVSHDGRPIGKLVTAAFSPIRGDWLGLALLDRQFAHAGGARYQVEAPGRDPVIIRTASPPVINNRSLFVDPQRHSAWNILEDDFPPLATEVA